MKQEFNVGDQVKLLYGSANDALRWWTVQAVDERFVVLTRQADFKSKGVYCYTIIDWVRDLRGPCNQIGQGWDFKTDTLREDGARLLRALNAHLEFQAFTTKDNAENGTTRWTEPEEEMVEVSYRNNVFIGIEDVRVPA